MAMMTQEQILEKLRGKLDLYAWACLDKTYLTNGGAEKPKRQIERDRDWAALEVASEMVAAISGYVPYKEQEDAFTRAQAKRAAREAAKISPQSV